MSTRVHSSGRYSHPGTRAHRDHILHHINPFINRYSTYVYLRYVAYVHISRCLIKGDGKYAVALKYLQAAKAEWASWACCFRSARTVASSRLWSSHRLPRGTMGRFPRAYPRVTTAFGARCSVLEYCITIHLNTITYVFQEYRILYYCI